MRARVPAYVSARPGWEQVKSVWLGTSAACDLMGVFSYKRLYTVQDIQ